jgi:hypothetical protein
MFILVKHYHCRNPFKIVVIVSFSLLFCGSSRRILNALKYKDTTGSSSDYGFYSDEFNLNCETENKPHDYEEIDDMSVYKFS